MSKKKENKMEEKEIEIKDEETKDEEKSEDEIQKDTSDSEETSTDEVSTTELEEKVKTLQDSLLRKVAEFENYKRRTENDQINLLKYSAESFILKVLPVYDDLGRSLNHIDDDNKDSIKEGLKLVHDKFTKILEEQGVKKLDVLGKEFDVDYHEALMQQPSDEHPANTILNEVEAGYIYKDKVIKHAKVIVSNEVDNSVDENQDSNNENEE